MVKGIGMEKERGSAIILAILLLSVFTALSMNMYYLVEKKGERAVAQAVAKQTLARLDKNIGFAYYETAVAHEMSTEKRVDHRRTFSWPISTTEVSDFFMKVINGNLTTANSVSDFDQSDPSDRIFYGLTSARRLTSADGTTTSIGGYKIVKDETDLKEYKKEVNLVGPYKDATATSTDANYIFEKNRLIFVAELSSDVVVGTELYIQALHSD